MDKSRVDAFLALHSEVVEAAQQVRDIYCQIHRRSTKYLWFHRIEDETIYFRGDEYWKFGGHDVHTLELPLSHIYDEAWIAIEREKVAASDAVCEKLEAEAAAKQRQWEMERLAALKKKYEAA